MLTIMIFLGKTYLELTKLVQGYLAHKYIMNDEHSAYYDCDYYQDGTEYYPYSPIKSDGDWTCYGTMHKCFDAYPVNICKPVSNFKY